MRAENVIIMRDGSGEIRCRACFFHQIVEETGSPPVRDHQASKMQASGLVPRKGVCPGCKKEARWWGSPRPGDRKKFPSRPKKKCN